MSLTFSGPAEALIMGPPVDLSRQRNGDMVLAFSIRLDGPLSGPLELGFGRARTDIAPLLGDARPGVWRSIRIPLACFDGEGSGVASLETPFLLRSTGSQRVSVAEIGLISNEGGLGCQAAGTAGPR